MKKIFALLLIASAFFTFSASAQKEIARGKMGAQKQVLIDSLKLSDAAADSIISIRMQSITQIKSIMSDQALTQEQKREKIKPIKEEMKIKLEKYLTKEQMDKLMSMQGEMRKDKSNEQ